MRTLEGHPHNRIYRFVEPGVLPEGVAVDIDYVANVTRIDRAVFDGMDRIGQKQIWNTQTPLKVGTATRMAHEPYEYGA